MSRKQIKSRTNPIFPLLIFAVVIAMLLATTSAWATSPGLQEASPFEGVIAYIELDGDIYLLIGGTGERVQLTFDANMYKYQLPKFSPNGRYLAFQRTNPEKGESYFELFVMDLGTKETRLLAENVDDWGNYDWAPDSQSIIFGMSFNLLCHAPDQTETYGIYRVQLDSGLIEEIIAPEGPLVPLKKPEYSFDGNWISFESFPCYSEGFALQTYDLNSNTAYGIGYLTEGDWSPIQNHITFSLNNFEDGYGAIIEGNGSLSETQPLLESSGKAIGDPHWSPDGQLMAVRKYPLTESMYIPEELLADWEDQVVIQNLSDNTEQIACSTQEPWGCKIGLWSPSGRQIIYSLKSDDREEYYLYTLADGKSLRLPEFDEGGFDWIASVESPPVSTQVAIDSQQSISMTTTTFEDQEPTQTPERNGGDTTDAIPIVPVLSICGGAGIIILGVGAMIYFYRRNKK